MRRKDLNVPALLLEAVVIILSIGYMIMQVVYGIYYRRGAGVIVMNCLVMLLLYAFFTLLSIYPERVNRIPLELCQGKIRKLTLWMIRVEKLIFSAGLVIPCVFDVLGKEIPTASSLILVAVMILVVAGFEWAIIKELRNHFNKQ